MRQERKETAGRLRWRAMGEADLPAVLALADAIHPDLPEEMAVFRSRIAVFPEGALVLDGHGADAAIAGYAIAHPIARDMPPALGTVLDRLPDDAAALYVHDVALAPASRGSGAGARVLERLLEVGRGFRGGALDEACLVSVYGTAPYWSRFGFRAAPDRLAAEKLASYGGGAVYMVQPIR